MTTKLPSSSKVDRCFLHRGALTIQRTRRIVYLRCIEQEYPEKERQVSEKKTLVQRDAVVDLRKQINGMTKNIQVLSALMKTLYEDENLGINLRKLRDDTRDDAMVCLKDILPLSVGFVSCVTHYFENSGTLEYDQWCRLISRILEKTIGYRQLSERIRQRYEDSLVPLKKRQYQAKLVQAEMRKRREEFQRRQRELEDTARTKRKWAIVLAFLPIVNIIAYPTLSASAGLVKEGIRSKKQKHKQEGTGEDKSKKCTKSSSIRDAGRGKERKKRVREERADLESRDTRRAKQIKPSAVTDVVREEKEDRKTDNSTSNEQNVGGTKSRRKIRRQKEKERKNQIILN
ncbi:eukaryotic translation initiation factor 5B-like [Montipora foliosa]|uniref:eukaryotic translation initiation factor 5B-like n=1 Tax=Montipora foliosa TaxID=591990 RepID=UPI0035F13C8E